MRKWKFLQLERINGELQKLNFWNIILHRKSSPQHFFVFSDFLFFSCFGGLKVGGFPKKQCFFRIHRTKVRKQSANQVASQVFNISKCEIRCQLSIKKIRSKKSISCVKLDMQTTRGSYRTPPPRPERVKSIL